MTTYRRKPVTVEAIVWDGTNDAEVREFVGDAGVFRPMGGPLAILSVRGDSFGLRPGDAIVKDPDGGFSVSAAVFGRDYEAEG